MQEEIVSNFGVHWATGGIAFLHQTRGALNALGLHERSPFLVKPEHRMACNHMIALNAMNPSRVHLTQLETLLRHNNLVRFMLPLPKLTGDKGVARLAWAAFPEEWHTELTLLSKLSSPIRVPIFPVNGHSPSRLLAELGMTNVQPMVVTHITTQHMEIISKLLARAATAPRKLLLVAREDVPLPGVPLTHGRDFAAAPKDELIALPWETLGGVIVRAYMRREWDGDWFTREPIPANEPRSAMPKA